MSDGAPTLSVVVALIAGTPAHLRACLEALDRQEDPPTLEILVPYDPPVAEVVGLASRFSAVRFLPAPDLDSAAARAGGSREHHDTLRTIGLRHARGRVVALTEDHARVSATWCRDLMRVLDALPDAVAVGGAVEHAGTRALERAIYLCDFGRYQNPLPAGPATNVSDTNVAYRRDALEAVRDAWDDDYHEPVVHAALRARGGVLWRTPACVSWQARGPLRLGPALCERHVWGRSYAGTRLRGAPVLRRLAYAALAPVVLPALLSARVVRVAAARGRIDRPFLRALPLVLLLHTVWAGGEAVGYLTGAPAPRPRPRA